MTDAEKDGFRKNEDRETYEQTKKKDLDYHPDDPNFVRIKGNNDYWERYDSSKHNQDS